MMAILVCPKCGYPQYCPCDSCKKNLPEGYKPWIWDETGNLITCANCGLTMHEDEWLSESEKQNGVYGLWE